MRHVLSASLVVLTLLVTGSPLRSAEYLSRGQYKIKPHERDRLTAADVVGPDGVVYPDWTRTGVQGSIPAVKAVAAIEDFAGRPDDGRDDSEALARACEAAGKKGGGAVVLAAGTYHLDRPVTVRHDSVVIRGQGAARTKLIVRYAIPKSGVAFYHPPAESRVGRDTRLELHCRPSGLLKMTMLVDDVVIGRWARGKHSGNSFTCTRYGRDAIGKLPDGRHRLKGVAEYRDGSKREGSIPIVLDSSYKDTRGVADSSAAIMFAGNGWAGPRLKLARDGRRGATELVLESTRGLRSGDCIYLEGPATERWKKLTRNACRWGLYRCYEVVIEEVAGKKLRIGQPLRIDFPVVDGSYVRKVEPIRTCGIESLTLEQTENLWISGVIFSHGWNCWARGVIVKKCGRFPVYGLMAKWCEIRDCVFDDAWFKGGGARPTPAGSGRGTASWRTS